MCILSLLLSSLLRVSNFNSNSFRSNGNGKMFVQCSVCRKVQWRSWKKISICAEYLVLAVELVWCIRKSLLCIYWAREYLFLIQMDCNIFSDSYYTCSQVSLTYSLVLCVVFISFFFFQFSHKKILMNVMYWCTVDAPSNKWRCKTFFHRFHHFHK